MTNNAAKAGLDAILALLGAGALLRVYTGAEPASADDPATGTLLAELAMTTPAAFGAATDGGGFALATAGAIADDASADAGGDPGYYRLITSGGTTVTQGTAGGPASGAEIEFSSGTFQAGGRVSINDFFTQKLFET